MIFQVIDTLTKISCSAHPDEYRGDCISSNAARSAFELVAQKMIVNKINDSNLPAIAELSKKYGMTPAKHGVIFYKAYLDISLTGRVNVPARPKSTVTQGNN